VRDDDQLDIVLTSGERSAETLIVSGPLHLWARLVAALGTAQLAMAQVEREPASSRLSSRAEGARSIGVERN